MTHTSHPQHLQSSTSAKSFCAQSTNNFFHLDNSSSTPRFKMGRLHSKGKGISASAIPYSRTPPAWLKTTPDQVVDQICKLAKKGATPSQIGVVLRDSHGIAQVKVVTGTSRRNIRLQSNAMRRGNTNEGNGNRILTALF